MFLVKTQDLKSERLRYRGVRESRSNLANKSSDYKLLEEVGCAVTPIKARH